MVRFLQAVREHAMDIDAARFARKDDSRFPVRLNASAKDWAAPGERPELAANVITIANKVKGLPKKWYRPSEVDFGDLGKLLRAAPVAIQVDSFRHVSMALCCLQC